MEPNTNHNYSSYDIKAQYYTGVVVAKVLRKQKPSIDSKLQTCTNINPSIYRVNPMSHHRQRYKNRNNAGQYSNIDGIIAIDAIIIGHHEQKRHQNHQVP